jgi:hypothetical protein
MADFKIKRTQRGKREMLNGMFYLLYSLDELDQDPDSQEMSVHHHCDMALDEGMDARPQHWNLHHLGPAGGPDGVIAAMRGDTAPRYRFVDCPNCSGSLDTVVGLCAHCGYTASSTEARRLTRAQSFELAGVLLCVFSALLVAATHHYPLSWFFCATGLGFMLYGMHECQKLTDERMHERGPLTEESSAAYRFGGALLAIMIAAIVRGMLTPVLGFHSPFFTFLIAILYSAWYYGTGPALLATFIAVNYVNYNYIPPVNSVSVTTLADALHLIVMVVSAVSVTIFCEYQRKRHMRLLMRNTDPSA